LVSIVRIRDLVSIVRIRDLVSIVRILETATAKQKANDSTEAESVALEETYSNLIAKSATERRFFKTFLWPQAWSLNPLPEVLHYGGRAARFEPEVVKLSGAATLPMSYSRPRKKRYQSV
jgi:hypothetical protein